MTGARADHLTIAFLFGTVFCSLCGLMSKSLPNAAPAPAAAAPATPVPMVPAPPLFTREDADALRASFSAQLGEVSGAVKLLQLGRLHDKWVEAEHARQAKEREAADLQRQLDSFPPTNPRRPEVEVAMLRARAAMSAQVIIRHRLMEEMRGHTYPGYLKGPDNSTTFTHQDFPDAFDPAIPVLKGINDTLMNANAYGVWAWGHGTDPHTANLIVIASDAPPRHTLELLLRGGYIVWKRHYPCPRECRELVSYLSYLADDSSPAKPMPRHIAFIHGHEESWHQPSPLLELIDDGVECSSKTRAYVPLGHHGMPLGGVGHGTRDGRMANAYAEHLGEFGVPRGNRLEGFCCAQFVVTPELIRRNTMSFYKTFLEKKLELKVDGFLGEFAFGWIFGDPEVRRASGGPPAVCRKPRQVTAPFVNASRSGVWTNPAANPRLTVVLGERSANETQNLEVVGSLLRLLPSSTNVWMRHESHWCSAGNWVGDHCCGPHRGYLTFMNTFKNDEVRTESDAYVFVKGGRVFTREDVDLMLSRVQCARRTGKYTPLRDTPHRVSADRLFEIPMGSTIGDFHWRGELKGFAGGEFVVPHRTLSEAPVDLIQSVYETHVNGCGIWKADPAATDHYWHWIMGEQPVSQTFNCTEADVWKQ